MKKYTTLFIIFLILPLLFLSCKKDGEIISAPSFGKLAVKFTSANASEVFLLEVDGVVQDTVSKIGELSLESGKRRITIFDVEQKQILDTTVEIDVRRKVSLSCFFNGTTVFTDNLDPALKPQTDSLLVRFVSTDKALPELMDIQISLYDFGGTIIPLMNKTIKGIGKNKFSEYIQLPNPNVIDPNFDATFMFYVIEGFDATPGANYQKVMSIDDFSFTWLTYKDDGTFSWVPNNIISLGIGAAPEDGSSSLRTSQLIFQREVN